MSSQKGFILKHLIPVCAKEINEKTEPVFVNPDSDALIEYNNGNYNVSDKSLSPIPGVLCSTILARLHVR